MKFTFDYKETLSRRVVIDANNLQEATQILYEQLENETIVLGSEDFLGAQVSMPLSKNNNYLPRLEYLGEEVKAQEDYDIVLDFW